MHGSIFNAKMCGFWINSRCNLTGNFRNPERTVSLRGFLVGKVWRVFAKATLIERYNKNRTAFSEYINSEDIGTSSGQAASIQLNLPSHSVGISAWDQGNRLEILTIDVVTEEAKVEYKSFSTRLFRPWAPSPLLRENLIQY